MNPSNKELDEILESLNEELKTFEKDLSNKINTSINKAFSKVKDFYTKLEVSLKPIPKKPKSKKSPVDELVSEKEELMPKKRVVMNHKKSREVENSKSIPQKKRKVESSEEEIYDPSKSSLLIKTSSSKDLGSKQGSSVSSDAEVKHKPKIDKQSAENPLLRDDSKILEESKSKEESKIEDQHHSSVKDGKKSRYTDEKHNQTEEKLKESVEISKKSDEIVRKTDDISKMTEEKIKNSEESKFKKDQKSTNDKKTPKKFKDERDEIFGSSPSDEANSLFGSSENSEDLEMVVVNAKNYRDLTLSVENVKNMLNDLPTADINTTEVILECLDALFSHSFSQNSSRILTESQAPIILRKYLKEQTQEAIKVRGSKILNHWKSVNFT